jgi:hypothetical protein
MTIDAGSERDAQNAPGGVISVAASGPARQRRAANGHHRVITLGIELDAVAHFLRSRRFHEHVIVGVIVLAALASMARENQARTRARVAAWDRRRNLRYQHTAKARSA